jgi:hypothetical protein
MKKKWKKWQSSEMATEYQRGYYNALAELAEQMSLDGDMLIHASVIQSRAEAASELYEEFLYDRS